METTSQSVPILKDVAIGRAVAGFNTDQLPESIRIACHEGARAIELLHQIGNYAHAVVKKTDKRDRERNRAREKAASGNQGTRWTLEEEARLETAFRSGTSLNRLAADHDRSDKAIVLRLLAKSLIDQTTADRMLGKGGQA